MTSSPWPLIDFFADPSKFHDLASVGVDCVLFSPKPERVMSQTALPVSVSFGSSTQINTDELRKIEKRLAQELSDHWNDTSNKSDKEQEASGFFPQGDFLYIDTIGKSVMHVSHKLPWLTPEILILTDFIEAWACLAYGNSVGYIDIFVGYGEFKPGVRSIYSKIYDKKGRQFILSKENAAWVTDFTSGLFQAYEENMQIKQTPLALRFDLVNGAYYPLHEWSEFIEWEDDNELAKIMLELEQSLHDDAYPTSLGLLFVFDASVDSTDGSNRSRLEGEALTSRPLLKPSAHALAKAFYSISNWGDAQSMANALRNKEINGMWSVDFENKRFYLGFSRAPDSRSTPTSLAGFRVNAWQV